MSPFTLGWSSDSVRKVCTGYVEDLLLPSSVTPGRSGSFGDPGVVVMVDIKSVPFVLFVALARCGHMPVP